jgi:hypothetical protein
MRGGNALGVLTRGGPAPRWDRPVPLALSDDDLDFYDHDHQHHRQEVKMFGSHLFLQVKAGGKIPSAFSFWRQCMNEWFMAWGADRSRLKPAAIFPPALPCWRQSMNEWFMAWGAARRERPRGVPGCLFGTPQNTGPTPLPGRSHSAATPRAADTVPADCSTEAEGWIRRGGFSALLVGGEAAPWRGRRSFDTS